MRSNIKNKGGVEKSLVKCIPKQKQKQKLNNFESPTDRKHYKVLRPSTNNIESKQTISNFYTSSYHTF